MVSEARTATDSEGVGAAAAEAACTGAATSKAPSAGATAAEAAGTESATAKAADDAGAAAAEGSCMALNLLLLRLLTTLELLLLLPKPCKGRGICSSSWFMFNHY